MKDWRVGLGLALATMALWSTLPIAATLALQGLDPFTLTWARFAFAAVVTLAGLAVRGRLGRYRSLSRRQWGWLGLAALGLVGNYVLYLLGLARTTPGNAQVLIQAAPLLLGLGSMVFFRERLNRTQWLGVLGLLLGMGLFFSEQLAALAAQASRYVAGTVILVLAAASWAAYGLIQKHLSPRLDGQQVLGIIYLAGTLTLWPAGELGALGSLGPREAAAVFYCAVNTVLAYGAFAASVERWDSSRVSAVITMTPLGTLGLVALSNRLGLDWVAPEQVAGLGWLGAGLVVVGSMTVSLAGRKAMR